MDDRNFVKFNKPQKAFGLLFHRLNLYNGQILTGFTISAFDPSLLRISVF